VQRILIGKVGLDGHEAGAKMIAAVLRNAGYEVIYLGKRNTVDYVVTAAIQEDVDLIGISLLSGIHHETARELSAALAEHDLDLPVVMGGIIPPQDVAALEEAGIARVFGPGSSTEEIVGAVQGLLAESAK
jgi:methylmalonyl-CoA mutase C-terminal domain/subunit